MENPDFKVQSDSVKLKISGDGAQMTRNTHFIILSLAIPDSHCNVLSAKGNHSIAIVKGSECYKVLRRSFRGVF